jgi:hypothetical protein
MALRVVSALVLAPWVRRKEWSRNDMSENKLVISASFLNDSALDTAIVMLKAERATPDVFKELVA